MIVTYAYGSTLLRPKNTATENKLSTRCQIRFTSELKHLSELKVTFSSYRFRQTLWSGHSIEKLPSYNDISLSFRSQASIEFNSSSFVTKSCHVQKVTDISRAFISCFSLRLLCWFTQLQSSTKHHVLKLTANSSQGKCQIGK